MPITDYTKIKEKHTASQTRDLLTIDLMNETGEGIVQNWHIAEVQRRIKNYQNKTDLLIDEKEAFDLLNSGKVLKTNPQSQSSPGSARIPT